MNNLVVEIFIAFFTALVTATVTFWGAWRQVKADLEKEYQSRFNEHKWRIYTDFMIWMGSMAHTATSTDKTITESSDELANELNKQYHKLISNIMIVGSDGVVAAINEMYLCLKKAKNIEEIFPNVAFVAMEMRKDLGYSAPAKIKNLLTATSILFETGLNNEKEN